MTWQIGDKAKWLGEASKPPSGACVDWDTAIAKPMTREQKRMQTNMRVTVVALGWIGEVARVRADDGFEFDPSVSPDLLKPAEHEGWTP